MENKQISTQSKVGEPTHLNRIKSAEVSKSVGESERHEILAVFRYVFVLMGINKNLLPEGEAIDVLVNYLKSNINKTPLEEIKLAFEFAVSRKTDVRLKLFGETFSLNMVMEVYDAYKKYTHSMATRLIEKPNPTEMTDEAKQKIIKEGALKCFENYKADGKIMDAGNITYNYLDSLGLISLTNERKKEIVLICKAVLIQNEKEKMISGSDKKRAIDILINGRSTALKSESRRYALREYFNNLIEIGEELSELIKETNDNK